MFAWIKRWGRGTPRLPYNQNARPTYPMPPAPPPLPPLYYREIERHEVERRRSAGAQYSNSAAPAPGPAVYPFSDATDLNLATLAGQAFRSRSDPDLSRASAWPPLDEIKSGGGGEFAGGGASGGWDSGSSSDSSSSGSSSSSDSSND